MDVERRTVEAVKDLNAIIARFREAKARRGKFQDIKQQVGLGMERLNQDKILSLIYWGQEEEKFLENLLWQSSYKASLANRKYKLICYLFEMMYTVAIKSSVNITQNSTGLWQLI